MPQSTTIEDTRPILALTVRKTMLVVDPESTVNEPLSRLVSHEGWNIRQAADNQAALAVVEKENVDLIITGQKTSGREDLALLQKMRSIRPHIRMIILTEIGTPKDVISSLRENVFSFFRAPFEKESLVHMVHMAMTQPCWDDGIEVIAATPNWIRLLARCTKQTAARLIQFLRQADLPCGDREDLALAAHEILLNAMEHGGNFDPNEYVEIGYLRTRRAVTCRVKDPGNGFSLEELRHAAINSPPGDLFSHLAVREARGLRDGGFGLLLASKLVDEIIRGEHGNDVILVKYIDPSSGKTSVANA